MSARNSGSWASSRARAARWAARLALDDQGAGAAMAGALDQGSKSSTFDVSPVQHLVTVLPLVSTDRWSGCNLSD
jgi:hypothetical protein